MFCGGEDLDVYGMDFKNMRHRTLCAGGFTSTYGADSNMIQTKLKLTFSWSNAKSKKFVNSTAFRQERSALFGFSGQQRLLRLLCLQSLQICSGCVARGGPRGCGRAIAGCRLLLPDPHVGVQTLLLDQCSMRTCGRSKKASCKSAMILEAAERPGKL